MRNLRGLMNMVKVGGVLLCRLLHDELLDVGGSNFDNAGNSLMSELTKVANIGIISVGIVAKMGIFLRQCQQLLKPCSQRLPTE